jgi:hypothetical protein
MPTSFICGCGAPAADERIARRCNAPPASWMRAGIGRSTHLLHAFALYTPTMKSLRSVLFVALACTTGLSASAADKPSTQSEADYLASCAAAMSKKAAIVEEMEKKEPTELIGAVGHYFRLSCAFSSSAVVAAAFERHAAKQDAALMAAVKTCNVDSACLAKFVEKLDGQLLSCAGFQKQNAELIQTAQTSTSADCNIVPSFK